MTVKRVVVILALLAVVFTLMKFSPSGAQGADQWFDAGTFKGRRWLRAILCLFLLAGVFAAERILRGRVIPMFRRAWKLETYGPSSASSIDVLFRPVSLLIWVYGSYAALSPLFVFFQQADGGNPLHSAMRKAAEVGGVAAVVWLAYLLVLSIDEQIRQRIQPGETMLGSFVAQCRAPLRLLIALVLVRTMLSVLEDMPYLFQMSSNALAVLLICSVAWLIIRSVGVAEDAILAHYAIDQKDNLLARRVQTQVHFFRKVITGVVIVVSGASALMLFEKARELGASILTSAGILGVVVGLAAQRSIANLLVGLQIAVTQPIRIDDVVIVENEWGRIEEINSTYAVIRLWDLRRLIVPLTYFTEKPFQNWTRNSSEILGTVFVYTDYAIPVELLRGELLRLLENSHSWDGKVWALQVTNATEHTMEIRALMSAADASMAWDLRCEVREGLITFIQKNFPESLPKTRLEISAERKKKPVQSF